jgi:hypothetical protein
MARQGAVWSGKAWRGRPRSGKAWCGELRLGMEHGRKLNNKWRGAAGPGSLWLGMVRQGPVGYAAAGLGMVRCGVAS